MKYNNIKKYLPNLIYSFIILLTIVNLCHLLMKYKYTAILFFLILSFVVYLFNKDLRIILGTSLILTNIINLFTNLFDVKLREGLADSWTRCANEGGQCRCTGTVAYARRFISGRPGSGAEHTVPTGPLKERTASGSIGCNVGVFGDPLLGYFKSCYCLSSPPPKPPPKPVPLNPVCDNIMDTKLCCDTHSNQIWNKFTGECIIK